MSEAIYYDGWHTCSRCGADKGGMDLWKQDCPRCAELAALEREIGRAYLEWRKAADVIEWSESQRAAADVDVAAYRAAQAREIEMEAELDNLTTRYRALLAAGAEAATGGGEARS